MLSAQIIPRLPFRAASSSIRGSCHLHPRPFTCTTMQSETCDQQRRAMRKRESNIDEAPELDGSANRS